MEKTVKIIGLRTAVTTNRQFLHSIVIATLLCLCSGLLHAQSTSQDFPTAIVSNEISGTIKARDMGDSRLTTYYFALNGDQGDLFINLVTRNFSGDIDVFTVNGLKPMTKIVVYADYGDVETGRAIYLRKPEKMILRINGRTPNDDAATFRLKFAGSFVAAKADEPGGDPGLPKVSSEGRGSVRVNSVGTILPPLPRPVETPAEKIETSPEIIAKSEEKADPNAKAEEKTDEKAEAKAETKPADAEKSETPVESKPTPSLEVVVTDPVETNSKIEPKPTLTTKGRKPIKRTKPAKPKEKPVAETPTEKSAAQAQPAEPEKAAPEVETIAPTVKTLTGKRRSRAAKKPVEPKPEPKPDPLASINLVIQFKDGSSFEKKMSEVFKFSVDKGIMTVILKDGTITKYPILDIAKVTIE